MRSSADARPKTQLSECSKLLMEFLLTISISNISDNIRDTGRRQVADHHTLSRTDNNWRELTYDTKNEHIQRKNKITSNR